MYVRSDLSVGLISVTTDIAWHVTVQWFAGNTMCKLVRYLQVCANVTPQLVPFAASEPVHIHGGQILVLPNDFVADPYNTPALQCECVIKRETLAMS